MRPPRAHHVDKQAAHACSHDQAIQPPNRQPVATIFGRDALAVGLASRHQAGCRITAKAVRLDYERLPCVTCDPRSLSMARTEAVQCGDLPSGVMRRRERDGERHADDRGRTDQYYRPPGIQSRDMKVDRWTRKNSTSNVQTLGSQAAV